ncbi:MAG: transposase [Methylococcaceae bacterium]|nr:transposase [Methylococcaceae bacterium]
MNEIITTLEALSPALCSRTMNQLIVIVEATLAMTGRVTMLGISRWTEKGGSYRTLQRFFKEEHDWAQLRWLLIKQHLGIQAKVFLIAGDEVVDTKSGKETYGLGTFFSSIQNKAIPGLCFIALSLIDVETRKAHPLIMEQLIREDVKKTAPKAVKKGKAGRPKDSKNKSRSDVKLSPFLSQLQGCIRQALLLIGCDIQVVYFVYDGALGNNAAVQMVKQTGLHLISKMRHDSVLYFQYTGEYSGRGRPKKYGDKITLDKLTEAYLCSTTIEKNIQTCVYQIQAWHKNFPDLLNVVYIVKTNLKTGRIAKVILFSDDVSLAAATLIDYYSLRFQIEFNFRDAKQYWGLEDFMNIKKTQVNNMANFSLFMVTFSQLLLPKIEGINPESMSDLKTFYRARKITLRIINSLGIKADEILIDDKIFQAAELGRTHAETA